MDTRTRRILIGSGIAAALLAATAGVMYFRKQRKERQSGQSVEEY